MAELDAERDEQVALFVDHENIYISLRDTVEALPAEARPAAAARALDVSRLAQARLDWAGRDGWVRIKLAVADWEALPRGQVREYERLRYRTAYNLPGRNSADAKIQNEIRDVLEDPDYADVGTYIIATGDGGYFEVIRTLLERRKQVHIWGVRGSTSPLLEAQATFFRYIDDLLGLGASTGDDAQSAEHDAPSPAGAPEVTPLEAFVILLDDELRQHGWQYLNFTRMLDFMASLGVFGQEREEALGWLNLAKEQAILLEQIIELAPQRGPWMHEPLPTRLRKLRLNRAHPLVQRALGIRDVVLECLAPTVGQRREVTFATVLSRLRTHPQLLLTEVQAKNWLGWFIEQTYVVSRTAPHRTLPQVQVTLLRLNPERAGIASSELPPDEQRRVDRLVVVLDNYLARNPRFTWMAASTLLSSLAPLSDDPDDQAAREAARETLRMAAMAGYLAIGSVPNRRFGGVTQTAVPRREHPHVQRLLRTRDALLRLLAAMLSNRPFVARGTFAQQAASEAAVASEVERVEWWVDLLIEQACLVADTLSEGDGPVVPTLGLNYQDLLVARLLSATS
ncbi:MAG: NYN domain-containing protein [Chloroflexi bacterium]|nr:NYN domain-containing protein [Chloroflexota bacterium]